MGERGIVEVRKEARRSGRARIGQRSARYVEQLDAHGCDATTPELTDTQASARVVAHAYQPA